MPRQRAAMLAAVKVFEQEALYKHRETICYNHAAHGSMNGFSRAFCRRFGELCADGRSVLLIHAGASMVDKRDDLQLPVQVLGLSGPRCCLILRTIGAHRLVGPSGPAIRQIARALEPTCVGKVLVQPWS